MKPILSDLRRGNEMNKETNSLQFSDREYNRGLWGIEDGEWRVCKLFLTKTDATKRVHKHRKRTETRRATRMARIALARTSGSFILHQLGANFSELGKAEMHKPKSSQHGKQTNREEVFSDGQAPTFSITSRSERIAWRWGAHSGQLLALL